MCISTNITTMITMATITTVIATNLHDLHDLHLAIAGNFAPVSSQTASSTLSLF